MSDAAPPPHANPAKPDWLEGGLSFSCTVCGDCCSGEQGYVWFSEDEAQAMADKVGMTKFDFMRTYAEKAEGKWTLKNVRNAEGEYDCVFLKPLPGGKRGCGLYEVRPQQCRTWPFWSGVLRSKKSWERVAKRCPGMTNGNSGEGRFYPASEIRIILKSNPGPLEG